MRVLATHIRLFAALAAFAGSLVGPAGSEIFAQDEAAPADKKTLPFVGTDACFGCHAGGQSLKPQNFILKTEGTRWKALDKHELAYDLLTGPLGTHMLKVLGIGDLKNAKQCLSCHSNWRSKEGYERPEVYEYGVGCEACHGAGGNYTVPHQQIDWRKKTPAEKDALGMIEVRNPIARAKQCYSCHIGSVAEGKVVTHDMYAAGHPPLPSMEIDTFCEQMPKHWRNLREKGDFDFRPEFIEANKAEGSKFDPDADLPHTRNVIVGGVMALRGSVDLLANQARASADNWPELAMYDCAACHHDLKIPSWRQARGYPSGKPGRPQAPIWPTALIKLAIRHKVGADDAAFTREMREFDKKLELFRKAMSDQPFGIPADIAKQGDEVVSYLDGLAEMLVKMPCDKAAAQRALQELVTLGESEYPDYHSARQILWAFEIIRAEASIEYPVFPKKMPDEDKKALQARIDAEKMIFDKWDTEVWDAARLKSRELTSSLDARLRLGLPATQKVVIAEELPDFLEKSRDFDSLWFREELGKVNIQIK